MKAKANCIIIHYINWVAAICPFYMFFQIPFWESHGYFFIWDFTQHGPWFHDGKPEKKNGEPLKLAILPPQRGAVLRLTNLLLGSTVRNLAARAGSWVNARGWPWEFLHWSNIGISGRFFRCVVEVSRVVLSYRKAIFCEGATICIYVYTLWVSKIGIQYPC